MVAPEHRITIKLGLLIIMELVGQPAPLLHIGHWINTTKALELDALKDRVVVLHAFQMLCPGCILHGVPQAQRIYNLFPENEVVVIGVHTVFEHHNVMGREALEAFVHEFRLTFPIGIDLARENHSIPQTMARYQMRGTPSLILIDGEGIIRWHHFGRPDDMLIGSQIAQLVSKNTDRTAVGEETGGHKERTEDCDANGCSV